MLGGPATSRTSITREGATAAPLRNLDTAPARGRVSRVADERVRAYSDAAPETDLLPGMPRVMNELLVVNTGAAPDFVDITDAVAAAVQRSGVRNGQVLVFSRHTTAAVRIQEAEPLLLQDIIDCLERLLPRDLEYRHNDFRIRTVNMTEDESPNGHAHCRHLFLGASETVPVIDGQLALGRWQRIFLIELDHPRRREVQLQVLGLG